MDTFWWKKAPYQELWLVLQILDHEVSGTNLPEGRIQLITVWHYIAQNLSLSPFHHPDIT